MRNFTLPLVIFAACVLAGCASSSQIVNQWHNPDYGSARFMKILVVGISKQAGIRRTFEDEFAAKLKANGVDAVASYHYIPEDGKADEARLQQAVKQASADASIITRLVRVETRAEFFPPSYAPAPAITYGFYPGYAWLGYYEPPRVYQYAVYIAETNLYDLEKNQLVWSGTVATTDPSDINKAIKRYVAEVIDALKNRKLVPQTNRTEASEPRYSAKPLTDKFESREASPECKFRFVGSAKTARRST